MPLTPILRAQLLDIARLALDLIESEAREPVADMAAVASSLRPCYQAAHIDTGTGPYPSAR